MKDVLELVDLFEKDIKNAIQIYAEDSTRMDINAFEYSRLQGKLEESEVSIKYMRTIKDALLNIVDKNLTDCLTNETKEIKNIIIDCQPRPEGLDEKQEALNVLYPEDGENNFDNPEDYA